MTRRRRLPVDGFGLLETCGVVDRNFGGVPARHPDRLIKWFIEVVLLGVGVNLLSSYVVPQDWAWLPPARFVAALLVAVPSAGLLRRERYGTTRARAMAVLALTGYLAITVWGSVTGWPLAVMSLSVAYLWETGVMLMWSTPEVARTSTMSPWGQSVCWGSRSCWIDGH